MDEKNMTEETQNKKNGRRWRRFLGLWSAGLLLLGALGCAVLYRYLGVYERTLPEHVMDSLMETTAPEIWRGYVREGMRNELGFFDDMESLYAEYESTLLKSDEFSYRRDAAASDKEHLSYLVRSSGRDVCRVTLSAVPGDRQGFGLHMWQVEMLEPCSVLTNLRSVTVEVEALSDAEVFINGRRLDEYYISDLSVPCPGMTELEKRFDAVPHFVRYRVDAMYGSIVVTDGEGNELRPDADSAAGVAHYTVEPERYAVTVTAPEDVTVTVNGAELTAAERTASDRGVLAGLEKYTGDAAYDTCTYALSGLYSVPRVSAVSADGQELTPVYGENGQITFFHPHNEALYDAAVSRVKSFFNAYINYSSYPFLGDRRITRDMLRDPNVVIDDDTRYSMNRYYGLLDLIIWGTDLYNYVENSTDAMVWASATSVSYDELSFTDFSYVGDRCFTCVIRYKADFSAWAWYENYSYDLQNAYEMAFVLSDWGYWCAAAMSAVN